MAKHSLIFLLSLVILQNWSIHVSQAQTAQTAVISLNESIQLALTRSPLLRATREGTRGAEAQKKEAFTGFLPRLSTSYSYTQLDKTPTFTIPAAPPFPANTLATGTRDNYNWSLEARQPLFVGGGLMANYEINKIALAIASLEEITISRNIVLEVTTAYYNINKAQRLRDVARQTLELLNAHRDVAGYFFRAGLIPKNDLLHAEVELSAGRQFYLKAENALAMAEANFNSILRRDIGTPVQIAELSPASASEMTFDQCLKLAMQNRSELKIYDLRMKQAETAVQLAKSEYFPAVSLIGNYSRYGDDPSVSGSKYKERDSWQVSAVANWNFWEWGRTKNRVEVNQARLKQAQESQAQIRDQITLEVKNVYLQLEESYKQIVVSQSAQTAAEENLRISQARYMDQVATSTEVIDAQTRLTRVNSDYFSALADYHINRARLDRAMGRCDHVQ